MLLVLAPKAFGLSAAVQHHQNEAQEHKTSIHQIVELFTSQSCPYSPPADSLLTELNKRQGVLVLSWSVDYWDRMGWKDTLAHASYSARQAAYNRHMGQSGVKTPQMVFNGKKAVKGSKKNLVLDTMIAMSVSAPLSVQPKLTVQDNRVYLTLSAIENKVEPPLFLRLVYFSAKEIVPITSGQNKGKKLHYTHVVRYSPEPKPWQGKALKSAIGIPENLAGATHVAVLVQKGMNSGEIIGAATIQLPNQPNPGSGQ